MSSKKIRKANINGVLYDLTVQDAELYNDVIIKLKSDEWVSAVVEGESVFTQTVHVDGATADSTPAIFLQGSNNLGGTEEEYEAFSKLINVITSSNQFMFVASESPTIDFRVISKATIAAEGSQITEIENMQENISNLKEANTYSTEETVVGTWIDGKPIYRKVFTDISLPDCTVDGTAGEKVVETEIENVDSIVSLHYIIRNTEELVEWQATNYAFGGDNANAGIRIYFSNYNFAYLNNVLVVRNAKTNYSNKPINIILEYTKTTDTPPNA